MLGSVLTYYIHCLINFHKSSRWKVLLLLSVSWTIKKAEHQRTDAFKLWCRRRLLRTPWTARRSHLSILKEINSEYSLEGLMLKLKLQNFGHLMRRVNSLEKTLILGKIEGRGRRGWQRMVGWHHRLNGHEFEQTLGDGDGQGSLVCAVHGVTKSRTWLSDWTTCFRIRIWSLHTFIRTEIQSWIIWLLFVHWHNNTCLWMLLANVSHEELPDG